MSGVRQGRRLDHLLQLRERLDEEIAAEQVREANRARLLAERQSAQIALAKQERRDSVAAATVRAWAAQYGHPAPLRGRVPDSLIDLYLDAQGRTS